jgi:hypothetical protein
VIDTTDRRAEWIICRGELHPVSLGRVQCPHGGLPAVEICLRCHWLEDADGDRSDVSACHTPELHLASGGEEAQGLDDTNDPADPAANADGNIKPERLK